MFKKIIKEIAILILLILAIGLVFVIVFYDYNPASITIPKEVAAYELEEKTKKELQETLNVQNEQELVKTYIVDQEDLYAYESSKDYDKGKPNPFAKYTVDNNNGAEGNNTSSENNTNNGDSGKFLNTIGK